jgi:hypothetical protein
MRAFIFRLQLLSLTAMAVYMFGLRTASAQLFYEDFEDTTLASTNESIINGTIGSGIVSFDDTSATTRHAFVMRPANPPGTAWADPILTYSFDIKAPVVIGSSGTDELRFRAGIGNGINTLQAADFIYEVLLFSNGANSGAYTNNGNETAFVVANNQSSPLSFASPIDSSNVTLNAYQYTAYVRNNATSTFGQLKGISNMVDKNGATDGVGAIERFGIGSSTNAHTGTFALDNVRVVAAVDFAGSAPQLAGDVNGDGQITMADFDVIKNNFRQSPRSRSQGDLTGDLLVSLSDFNQWKGAFAGGGGSIEGLDMGFVSVPEPSSLALAGLMGLMLAGRRGGAVGFLKCRKRVEL